MSSKCYYCGQSPVHSIGECPQCQDEKTTRALLAKVMAENVALKEWKARAVESMNAASESAGVLCCDLIPKYIGGLRATNAALQAALESLHEHAARWIKKHDLRVRDWQKEQAENAVLRGDNERLHWALTHPHEFEALISKIVWGPYREQNNKKYRAAIDAAIAQGGAK